MDALTGILWKDDSQIIMLKMHKVYSDNPRIEMVVEEVNGKIMDNNRWDVGSLEWKQ
jgi:Holliday junction resolvase RusA-like endonuclease